jgi:hypothetical protein
MGAAPSSAVSVAAKYKKYYMEKWEAEVQAQREENDPWAKVHPASVSRMPATHPAFVSLQGSINLSGRELLHWRA